MNQLGFTLIIISILANLLFSQIRARLIAQNFDKPLYITNYPGDNDRLLVVEQDGVIKIIENNVVLDTPFLDISDRTHQTFYPADEMGLLGFAFHPKFKTNNFFYVNYVDQDDYTVISKYTVYNSFGDIRSEKILMKIKQPYMNHNGGCIEFGLDGNLYISVGDGGSAGDPENRAQDLSNLFGTILRINVDNSKTYSIPKDNPFYNSNGNDIQKEIWHYGLRNVWRFSFDKLTGDMYMGDVGQSNWEEINFQYANSQGGNNYGWNILEGTHCYPNDIKNCTNNNYIMPIYEYPNDANYFKTLLGWQESKMKGCSITGGYVYRGKNLPMLYGRYFFGDYCTGRVWSLNINKDKLDIIDHTNELRKTMNKKAFYLSSFGEDEDGELFIVNYSGEIYSITK